MGVSQISTLNRMLTMGGEISAPKVAERADDILNAIAEKLKRQSKDDFKGRHFEAADRAGGGLVPSLSAQLSGY